MSKLTLWEAVQQGEEGVKQWMEENPEYAYADADLLNGLMGKVIQPAEESMEDGE